MVKSNELEKLLPFLLVSDEHWDRLARELDNEALCGAARTAELLVIECDELSVYLKSRAIGCGHEIAARRALRHLRRRLGCGD